MEGLDAYFLDEQIESNVLSVEQLLKIETQERKKLTLKVENLERELKQMQKLMIQHFGSTDSKVCIVEVFIMSLIFSSDCCW
jgi:hypothetical protein